MHVTIAYSKKQVDWDAAGDHGNSTLTIDTGSRSIAKLGDQGAVVLKFSSEALKQRWQEFIDAGASWDWPNYQSHVTISFDAGDVDLDDITPYTGELVFGPEIFQKIDPNWKDNVSEKGLLERFNPNHEPAGSPEGGQFTSGDGGEGGGGSTSSGSFTHPSGKTWQQVAQTAVDKWKEGHPQVKAATVALKKDIDQAMAEAPQFEHYRDWYARHIPLAKKLFGDNEPYFEKFLAATSINASGKPNVDMALRATIHFINGGTFEAKNYKGVMGAIRTELLKVQNNEPLTGLKVVPFAQVLLGDWDHAPADRHMKNLLFQKPSEGPNKSQAEVTEVVFRAIAKEMGWKTAEIQAVLWCVDKAREEKGNSKNVFDYLQYMKTEEAKVRTLLVEHQQLKTSAAFKKSFDEDEVGDALEQEADAWSNAQLTLEYFQAIHDEVGDNPTPEDIADALDMLTEQKDFDESKHPRDDHGRFSDGGGDSESTSSPKGDGSDYAFFHGTADSLIASIKEHGLVPTGEQPKELGKEIAGADNWARDHHMAVGRHNIGNRATSVYVASQPVLAAAFAKIVVANHPGSKPVVLAIRVPEKEIEKHIVPDEWSDIPDAYRFIGKIPPDWIVDIGKFDPDTIPNLADHDQKRSFIEDLQREKNGDVIVHAVIIADEEKNEP